MEIRSLASKNPGPRPAPHRSAKEITHSADARARMLGGANKPLKASRNSAIPSVEIELLIFWTVFL